MCADKKVLEIQVRASNEIAIHFKDGQTMGSIGPLAQRFICENNLKVEVQNEQVN
jgi:hypothetical protein